MTNNEAEARVKLSQCYHIFAHKGWDEGIYNHITLRVPGEDYFLINNFGMLYSETTPQNLVRVSFEGIYDGHVNKAGLIQHLAFHRNGAHAVIHTHTTATMAVCALECGLKPMNFNACFIAGDVAYHPFEGVTVREDEAQRMVKNMGDKRILMLRNHGPVVIGDTIEDAFLRYTTLQRACEIQLATLTAPVVEIQQHIIEQHQTHAHVVSNQSGVLDFEAAVRAYENVK